MDSATETQGVGQDERNMAMLVHLLAFSGFVVPFAGIVAPLVLWLAKKDASRFVDAHGKEVVNFQLSLAIWTMISAVLVLILVGALMLLALFVVDIACTAIAASRASSGLHYRYPLTIRFLK